MTEKVYCRDCKWFAESYCPDHAGVAMLECNAPNNLEDTFLEPNGKQLQHPSDKNSTNDCPDYEAKE